MEVYEHGQNENPQLAGQAVVKIVHHIDGDRVGELGGRGRHDIEGRGSQRERR